MSSPRKRYHRPHAGRQRLAEASLPLHLALAWCIVKVFPLNEERIPVSLYSHEFTASILQLVCGEVLEINDAPITVDQLRSTTDDLVRKEASGIAKSNTRAMKRGQAVPKPREDAANFESWIGVFSAQFSSVADGCAFLDSLEKEVRERISETDDAEPIETPEPIDRRSMLGIFLRGLLVTLRKLSFDETAHLARQVGQWVGAMPGQSSMSVALGALNRKTAMEDASDKRLRAVEGYEAAAASGDYSGALAALRRFYDYQFPASGRGQHQHALLNLATFHYSTGGLGSAHAAIEEAIGVARAEGDKACLRQCMSLLHRLDIEEAGNEDTGRPPMTVRQIPVVDPLLSTPATPMDELVNLQAALDLGEPAHVALRRIHLSLARYEQTHPRSEPKDGWTNTFPFDEAGWHATQAGLWSMMGSEALAALHEDMALRRPDGGDEARLTILRRRAQRATEKGKYNEAMSILLDFETIEGMSMSEYHRWADTVWKVLDRQIRLSGDTDSVTILESMQPADRGFFTDPQSSQHRKAQETVRESLSRACKLQKSNAPPHLILPQVLSALHLASSLGLWPLYRFGVVVMCEVLLTMEGAGMATKALEELERVWSQVLGGHDLETIARGWLVRGKAKIDLGLDDSAPGVLNEAVDDLKQALASASDLGSRSLVLQITTLLALVADVQGSSAIADEYAQLWSSAKVGDAAAIAARREQVQRVGDVVRLVGVGVSTNWR